MEKSTKRAWKLSSVLMTLAIAMGLLSTRVFLTSSAADQLDQYQTTHSQRAWHHIHENKYWAQSFKAGLSGDLTKVTLYLKSEGAPQPLVIELRNCVTEQEHEEDYYAPGNTILASVESSNVTSTTGQEYSFTFSTAVSSGTSYTIVLYQKNK